MSEEKDFPRITLEVKCDGDEMELIKYLKNEIIPRLNGGFTSGYETWYKGWVANLQGNHSEETSPETIREAEIK